MLNLIARAVTNAHHVFAKGNRAETQRALDAAAEIAKAAVADADYYKGTIYELYAANELRARLYRAPWSNN